MKGSVTLLGLLYAVGMMAVIALVTGCVPLVLGIKDIQTAGGTKINFITGADVSASANGVDRVNNNRGIQPGDGYAGR